MTGSGLGESSCSFVGYGVWGRLDARSHCMSWRAGIGLVSLPCDCAGCALSSGLEQRRSRTVLPVCLCLHYTWPFKLAPSQIAAGDSAPPQGAELALCRC